MNWFGEQLKERKNDENKKVNRAINSIAGAVMGARLIGLRDRREIERNAIDEILQYYGIEPEPVSIPSDLRSYEQQLEYMMRPYGMMFRKVKLKSGWHKDAAGAMLGTLKGTETPVALIPGGLGAYTFLNLRTGKRVKIHKAEESLFDENAWCFYPNLPLKKLTARDLLSYVMHRMTVSELLAYLGIILLGVIIGMITPMLTKLLFGDVLNSGSYTLLITMVMFVISYSLCSVCITTVQGFVTSRFFMRRDIIVQAAVMNRIFSLPARFFKRFAAGELTQRAGYVQSLCSMLFQTAVTAVISSTLSLLYIGQITFYAPSLVGIAFLIVFASAVITVVTALMQARINRKRMEIQSKTSGLTYASFEGIQKIKLAGAETRAFARWAKQYSKEAVLEYNPPLFLKISTAVNIFVGMIGMIVIYTTAIKNGVSVADYYAFTSAFGMVSAAFNSLASLAAKYADIRPAMEMVKPILDEVPEMSEDKEVPNELIGAIDVSHVTFSYSPEMGNVLEDLTLSIKPGEFVAIVGSTGCGKSTLMRLLLGFESPQKGGIFYDSKDISRLDLKTLRRHIGVVMQDGKLFFGSIYENIVISMPELSKEDAWKAAEIASLADDIHNMPMGMETVISEGGGGISGGQRQRLMIARAIAPKPKVLFFDEATSALDNVTQKRISDAIDAMKCTRIVIAHRLSTIRHANRIVFLKDGNIAEEGTYDELIAKDGLFAEMIYRQRLDIEVE